MKSQRVAAKTRAPRAEPVDEPEPAEPVDEQDQDDDEPDEPDEPAAPRAAPAVVSSGAGWLLGLLAWAWIGLPMVKGGPVAVRNVWRAKFFNKAPDGSELP